MLGPGDDRPRVPLTPIVLIAAVLGGAALLHKPYRSLRPERAGELLRDERLGDAPVEAFLWQDPLQVVGEHERALEGDPRQLPEVQADPHSLEHLRRLLEQAVAENSGRGDGPGVVVLAALIPGSQTAMDSESRIRDRYAVVSALGAMEYTAREDRRLGYLRTNWRKIIDPYDARADAEWWLIGDGFESSAPGASGLAVPYEWFEYPQTVPADPQRPPQVLVLWIDEEFFGEALLEGLERLLTPLLDGSVTLHQGLAQGDLELRVLGPQSSDSWSRLHEQFEALATQSEASSAALAPAPATAEALRWRRDTLLRSIGRTALGQVPGATQDSAAVERFLEERLTEPAESDFFQLSPIGSSLARSFHSGALNRQVALHLTEHLHQDAIPDSWAAVSDALDQLRSEHPWVTTADLRTTPPRLLASLIATALRQDDYRGLRQILELRLDSPAELLDAGPSTGSVEAMIGDLWQLLEVCLPPHSRQDLTLAGLIGWAAPHLEPRRWDDTQDRSRMAFLSRLDGLRAPLLEHLHSKLQFDPSPDFDLELSLNTGDVVHAWALMCAASCFDSSLPWSGIEPLQLVDSLSGEPLVTRFEDQVLSSYSERGSPSTQSRSKLRELAAPHLALARRGELLHPERGTRRYCVAYAVRRLPEQIAASFPATGWEHLSESDRAFLEEVPQIAKLVDIWLQERVAAVRGASQQPDFVDPFGRGVNFRRDFAPELLEALVDRTADELSTSLAARLADAPDDLLPLIWREVQILCGGSALDGSQETRRVTSAVAQSIHRQLDVWCMLRPNPVPQSVWTELLAALPRYCLSDQDWAGIAELGLSELVPHLRADLEQLLHVRSERLDAPPRAAEDFLALLTATAGERRRSLVSYPPFSSTYTVDENPIPLAEQLVFELARAERDLAWDLAPTSRWTAVYELQFRLELELLGGIPSSVDRVAMLEALHRELDGWVAGRVLLPTVAPDQLGLVGGLREILHGSFRKAGVEMSTVDTGSVNLALGQFVDTWFEYLPEKSGSGTAGATANLNRRSEPTSDSSTRTRWGLSELSDGGSLFHQPSPMVRWIRETEGLAPSILEHLAFVNSRATYRPAESPATPASTGPTTSEAPRPWTDNLGSVIGTDEELVAALECELERRGFDRQNGDHLAIVSEGDTVYGRSFAVRFEEDDSANGGRVRAYTYLRGLDGSTPSRRGVAPRSIAPTPHSDPALAALGLKEAPIEDALGEGQLDYVRRLADRIARDAAALARQGQELFAVGIFGTDSYDKLLILEALRESLPRTLMFTTDLDARLIHGSQASRNRGLLVASHFDLTLAPALQGAVPPFRDTYQAATFLATHFALGGLPPGTGPLVSATESLETMLRWRDRGVAQPATPTQVPLPETLDRRGLFPQVEATGDAVAAPPPVHWHLFEIGRTRPVEITPDTTVPGALIPRWSWLQRIALWTLLLGTVALAASPGLRQALLDRSSHPDPLRAAWVRRMLWAIVGVATVLGLAIGLDSLSATPEPVDPFQGISLWPTVAGRLLAAAMGLLLVWEGGQWLQRQGAKIAADLGLVASAATPEGDRGGPTEASAATAEAQPAATASAGPAPRWAGLRRWLAPVATRSLANWRAPLTADGSEVDGLALWHEYCAHGRFRNRLWRSAVFALAGTASALTLLSAQEFGHPLARSTVSRWANDLSFFLLVVSLSLAIAFVMDAAYLFARFVQHLTSHPTSWPRRALERAADDHPLPDSALAEWIDMRVVAARSAAVGPLLIGPFAMLFVVLATRSSYFERWHWYPTLLLVLLVVAVASILPMLRARRAAEVGRRSVLKRLTRERALLSSTVPRAGGAPQREQHRSAQDWGLERMASEVTALELGPFSPDRRNPILRSLLLPAGGVGLMALFELLLLMGV
jgi:hypothetical protein